MLNQAAQRVANLPDSLLTTIGKMAYDDMLGRLRRVHAGAGDIGEKIRLNRAISDVYGLLRAVGQPFEVDDDVIRCLAYKLGWDNQRIGDLLDALRYFEDFTHIVDETKVDEWLNDVGLEKSAENLRVIAPALLPYLHDATVTAHRRLVMGRSMHPLPEEQTAQQGVDIGHFMQMQALKMMRAAASAPVPREEQKPAAPAGLEVKVSEALTDYLTRNTELSRDSVRQVRQAVSLFTFVNGDMPIREITQKHLGDFTMLMTQLPSRYGRTAEELAGGLTASLKRAQTLPPDQVGLSGTTVNKHVTWMSQVVSNAVDKMGAVLAHPAPDFSKVRKAKPKGKDSDKRQAWTLEELVPILKTPVWYGCAGLFERLREGDQVWHDAWYFGPLGLALHGTRCEEWIGLSLAEVYEDKPIPYVSLQHTDFRRLKNDHSVRDVPIHPELIRLGFIDYLGEMRNRGEALVFPEMKSPAETMEFDNVFYKQIFSKLRAHCYPNGTEWIQRNPKAKEKDAHSIRGAVSNLLICKCPLEVREDLLGHVGKSETRKTYDHATGLHLKLEALQHLTFLTQDIPAMPLQLRPSEWSGYGQRRGRPKKVRKCDGQ